MYMKKRDLFLIIIFAFFINLKQVFAVCPVCTVAVSAGVGLSRWLKIDDLITGLWIGGVTVSVIIWTLDFFKKKKIKFKGLALITSLAYYALVILPLYYSNMIGHPSNVFVFGMDKLLFSIILGSISFYVGANYYEYLKEKNNGRAYFPFQKVVMPIAPLIILTILFYILVK